MSGKSLRLGGLCAAVFCGLLAGILIYRAHQQPAAARVPVAPQRADAIVPFAALPVKADALGGLGNLVAAAPPPPPTVQESLSKIQKSLERTEKLLPATEELIREYSALAKSLREFLPDLRETNKELLKLIKSSNETMPQVEDALKEGTIAARNWGRVGERLNVLIGTNEDRINSIIKNLDTSLVGISDAFNAQNRADLANTLRNLSASSQRFPSISRQADSFLREGRQTQQKFNDTLRRADDVFDQLRGGKPDQNGRGPIKDFQEAATKFNATMTDVRELMRVLDQSDGTVRRFLVDPSLYNHLDDLARGLSRTLPGLERIMHNLEVFADKLARHPEALGLRGAIHPNSGLKDPPVQVTPHYRPFP
jgi:phospholipid/cholesterol/gamma-HCH transport system substrate-binding protein